MEIQAGGGLLELVLSSVTILYSRCSRGSRIERQLTFERYCILGALVVSSRLK